MRWYLIVVASLVLVRTATAAPPTFTLDQVIAKAIASPRVEMATGDRDAAAARVDEADAARLPRIKATAFGTISPDIQCIDANCEQTTPRNFAFRFSGLYGTAELDVTQPLYTFGKIGHARSAARAGRDAQSALADEAAGDVAADAARAYWGLKLARELGYMLDDGIEQIESAKAHFDERGHEISIQDKQRVAVLLAEAKVQRAEAADGEAQALAGLRALVGMADADIDDGELAAVAHELPAAEAVVAAAAHRPRTTAAQSGARAADELAAFEQAQLLPDVAIVASGVISHAQGVQDPPSAYAYDPYRKTGAGAGLGLSWTLEPWNVAARVDRARAEAKKQHAQAQLAELGARYDAESAHSEARSAHQKLDAAAEGEKAARAWLAAVLQNEAIGTAEARDLVDAYIAWFQMRARWATAVTTWNVAVVRLGRATGEYRAGASRQN